MNIVLSIVFLLLGVSITAAAYNRREKNMAELRENDARYQAEEKSQKLMEARQCTEYYQRQAEFWKGIAYGDKANAIYCAALTSIENGGGFTIQNQKKNNVIQFPTNNQVD